MIVFPQAIQPAKRLNILNVWLYKTNIKPVDKFNKKCLIKELCEEQFSTYDNYVYFKSITMSILSKLWWQ